MVQKARIGVSALSWPGFDLSFVICHLSYAKRPRQATPVAGGDVFRRFTRTLTFMD